MDVITVTVAVLILGAFALGFGLAVGLMGTK